MKEYNKFLALSGILSMNSFPDFWRKPNVYCYGCTRFVYINQMIKRKRLVFTMVYSIQSIHCVTWCNIDMAQWGLLLDFHYLKHWRWGSFSLTHTSFYLSSWQIYFNTPSVNFLISLSLSSQELMSPKNAVSVCQTT